MMQIAKEFAPPDGMMAIPFTPKTLAARWMCSPRHIRNMVKDGRLQAFRLGGKLLRIKASVVEEIEQCGDLEDIADNGPPSPDQGQAESVVRLARIERTLKEPSIA